MLVVLRHLRRPLTSAILAAAAVCLFLLFYGSASPLKISKAGNSWAPRSWQYWDVGDFGVRSYMFAGSALDGQPVVRRNRPIRLLDCNIKTLSAGGILMSVIDSDDRGCSSVSVNAAG